jgi:hypothetical protein
MVWFVAAAATLVLAIAPGSPARAQDIEIDEFDEFDVFIEINATDLDAGLQGKLDGDAWQRAWVFGPNRLPIFKFAPRGVLGGHGVTEDQWESNEPPFEPSDEAEPGYTLDAFLETFDEGRYTAWGKTIEGGWLHGVTELTHDLPAGPMINVPEEDEVVNPTEDLVVEWEVVTTEFDPEDPQGELTDPLGSDIEVYIVVCEVDEDDIQDVLTMEVAAPDGGGILTARIPADFLKPDLHYKVEVGAREASGNQTFWEVPFCTHDADECPEE